MYRKLIVVLAIIVASGCRMCSDSCDYSSPVAGGPYAGVQGRAGSVYSGETFHLVDPPPQESPAEEAHLNPQWSPPLSTP